VVQAHLDSHEDCASMVLWPIRVLGSLPPLVI